MAFAQKSDPDAKKVLDAVSSKFKSFKTGSHFTYKVENATEEILSTKKGTVTMKGTKYHDIGFWRSGNMV